MSWSQEFDGNDAIDKGEPTGHSTPFDKLSKEEQAQQIAALRTARALIAEGVLHGHGRNHSVRISGHAAPRPVPKGATTTDSIGIYINQKYPEAPAAAEVQVEHDTPPEIEF